MGVCACICESAIKRTSDKWPKSCECVCSVRASARSQTRSMASGSSENPFPPSAPLSQSSRPRRPLATHLLGRAATVAAADVPSTVTHPRLHTVTPRHGTQNIFIPIAYLSRLSVLNDGRLRPPPPPLLHYTLLLLSHTHIYIQYTYYILPPLYASFSRLLCSYYIVSSFVRGYVLTLPYIIALSKKKKRTLIITYT